MDQSPHSRSDSPWRIFCTCVMIKPIGAALNADKSASPHTLKILSPPATFSSVILLSFCLPRSETRLFPRTTLAVSKGTPDKHKNWRKWGYPGSRIRSRSNTASQTSLEQTVLFLRAADLDPKHTLSPPGHHDLLPRRPGQIRHDECRLFAL